uniref:Putative membrane glycoprotein lig-1 n=1 Tax=Corethrella appendiculata TaxID=1370023 RepID=U5EEF6_9DIPT
MLFEILLIFIGFQCVESKEYACDQKPIHPDFCILQNITIHTEEEALEANFSNTKNSRNFAFLESIIKWMPPKIFDGLFENVTATGIKLERINGNTFRNCKRTKRIDFAWNDIEYIEGGTFQNCPQLEHLYLNYNKIREIDVRAFNGLGNLELLYLWSNKITRISQEMFESLENLKILDLDQNLIEWISSDTFEELINLEQLRLYGNLLTQIEDGTFKNLVNLEHLELGSNPINSIHRDTFQSLPKLTKLGISHTNLKLFQAHPIDLVEDIYNISKLSNLSSLGIGGSHLDDVSPEFNLTIFAETSPNLERLYLHRNDLQRINYENIKEIYPKLEIIAIAGNNWQCDYLNKMLSYFRANNINPDPDFEKDCDDRKQIDGICCSESDPSE